MMSGDEYNCPKCDRRGYYKPPFNTPEECMSCRWAREHPPQSMPSAKMERGIVKFIYKLRAERRLYPELFAADLVRKIKEMSA